VRARIAADPWVAEVKVNRRLPDTIEFEVVERVPVALVDGTACLWVVDGHGWVVGKRSREGTPTLPVVRQLQNAKLAVGREVGSAALRNALAVLGGVSPSLRRDVVAVNAKSVDETALVTKGNVEILFGSADEMPKKDAIARQILAAQRGKVVFIDVRSTDRPVSRGLGK
jgi:cell division protein FtsQ